MKTSHTQGWSINRSFLCSNDVQVIILNITYRILLAEFVSLTRRFLFSLPNPALAIPRIYPDGDPRARGRSMRRPGNPADVDRANPSDVGHDESAIPRAPEDGIERGPGGEVVLPVT